MNFTPVRIIDQSQTQIVIVGVGGTGGYVLQQVARLVYGLKAQGFRTPNILLMDGDTVEEKNLLRQYFLPQDVGRKKAEVLAERYSGAYGIDIAFYNEYLNPHTPFVVPRASQGDPSQWSSTLIHNNAIVVGCVDNAPARRLLHTELSNLRDVVYIDSGNSAATPPEDLTKLDRYGLAAAKARGWEGQVLCGARVNNRDVLPFPAEVLPDLVEGDEDDPNKKACGEQSVSNPQRLMTNLMAATSVMMYLHTLLAEGTLVSSRTFFNAREGYTASTPAINDLLIVAA